MLDVSGDGRIKVGTLNVRDPRQAWPRSRVASIVWTGNRARIIDDVFPSLGGDLEMISYASAVSEDGRWIAGARGHQYSEVSIYRWHDGELADVESSSSGIPISISNGGVVVGENGDSSTAARWDDQGRLNLDDYDFSLYWHYDTIAAHITPDGRTTVGSAHHGYPTGGEVPLASRWIGSAPRPVPLWDPALDTHGSIAYDASDDGRVIVGISGVFLTGLDPLNGSPIRGVAAFRWTEEGVTWMGVPEFDMGGLMSLPWSTSADGAISIGVLAQGWVVPPAGPVILAGGRLRSLVDLLENEYGVDLEGWDLSSLGGWAQISGDGRTIVGQAIPPGGVETEAIAYQVHLPPPCSDGLDNDGDGAVDFPDDDGCRSPRDGSEERSRRGGPWRARWSARMGHR